MSTAQLLVVDDEPNIRRMLAGVLEDEGYGVTSATDAEEADEILNAGGVDLLLLDVRLPGVDGLTFLRSLQERECPVPVVMMSGHGTIRTAVEATRLGALDFIEKPIQVERLLVAIRNGLRIQDLRRENDQLREDLGPMQEIIGQSESMGQVRGDIARVAPTDARVLITGENGTGKELVARALHAGSKRAARAFVKVNCAAIPSELLESELFGHERGAFTGAVARRRGKFELAQRGTILLDEVGDMNPTTQAKLLRVLEEREMERVGGEQTVELDVRVLASTNQDLEQRITDGAFREDLYHRLKVVPIHVPPLREHPGDVAGLADHYLARFCATNGRPIKQLTDGARQVLTRHPWPGNVRELRNLMERVVIMVDGPQVNETDVGALLGGAASGHRHEIDPDAPLADQLAAFERSVLERSLAQAGENVAETARRLGLDRGNLHRRLTRLGLREGGVE